MSGSEPGGESVYILCRSAAALVLKCIHSHGSRCSPCADRVCRLFHKAYIFHFYSPCVDRVCRLFHRLRFFTVVRRVLIVCVACSTGLDFSPVLCACGSMSVSQTDDVWLLWVVACETGVRCA